MNLKDLVNLTENLENQQLTNLGEQIIKYKYISTFESSFFCEDLIVNDILEEYKINQFKEVQGTQESLVNIKYEYVNFFEIIQKIKIDLILERQRTDFNYTQYLVEFQGQNPKEINYIDDLFLAQLIEKNLDSEHFVESKTVQKLICIQYQKTKQQLKLLLFMYIFGFFIPFTYNSFSSSYNHDIPKTPEQEESYYHYKLRMFFYFTADITVFFFALLEIADIRYNGLIQYFSSGWNIFDFTQFAMFFFHAVLRSNEKIYKLHNLYKLFDSCLHMLICYQSVIKILQYIRIYERFSFLVQMICQVAFDLFPFISIFLLVIIINSITIIVLEGDVSADDYYDLPRYMRIIIQTYRDSIGDASPYLFGPWQQVEHDYHQLDNHLAIFLIWAIWLGNAFIMPIVLLNFVVAEVSQTFERVKSSGQSFIYIQRANLNLHIIQIEKFFNFNNKFVSIVIEQPNDGAKLEDDEDFDTIDIKVNQHIDFHMGKMNEEMKAQFTQISEHHKDQQATNDFLKKEVANIQKDLQKLIQTQKDNNNKKALNDQLNQV